MNDETICKKCKGKEPRRNQPECGMCGGAGVVAVTTDDKGRKIINKIKPAVR